MIGQIIQNSTSGEILSPNYPYVYASEADCRWTIQVDRGLLVQLVFVEFDMEDG